MEIKEGARGCVSVRSLYNMEGGLRSGFIVPDFTKSPNDCDYYDMYNADGELVCLDGEEVTIEKVDESGVTLRNDNGDNTVFFTLTNEEITVALFN